MSARKQGEKELYALERAIGAKDKLGERRQLGLRSSDAALPSLATPAIRATYPVTPKSIERVGGEACV